LTFLNQYLRVMHPDYLSFLAPFWINFFFLINTWRSWKTRTVGLVNSVQNHWGHCSRSPLSSPRFPSPNYPPWS
jgi:hypothetical protein